VPEIRTSFRFNLEPHQGQVGLPQYGRNPVLNQPHFPINLTMRKGEKGSFIMILGDLDLDWAEQDPDYLVRVKAFLQFTGKSDNSMPNHLLAPDSHLAELGLK
jgi:hypothetical protein